MCLPCFQRNCSPQLQPQDSEQYIFKHLSHDWDVNFTETLRSRFSHCPERRKSSSEHGVAPAQCLRMLKHRIGRGQIDQNRVQHKAMYAVRQGGRKQPSGRHKVLSASSAYERWKGTGCAAWALLLLVDILLAERSGQAKTLAWLGRVCSRSEYRILIVTLLLISGKQINLYKMCNVLLTHMAA